MQVMRHLESARNILFASLPAISPYLSLEIQRICKPKKDEYVDQILPGILRAETSILVDLISQRLGKHNPELISSIEKILSLVWDVNSSQPNESRIPNNTSKRDEILSPEEKSELVLAGMLVMYEILRGTLGKAFVDISADVVHELLNNLRGSRGIASTIKSAKVAVKQDHNYDLLGNIISHWMDPNISPSPAGRNHNLRSNFSLGFLLMYWMVSRQQARQKSASANT